MSQDYTSIFGFTDFTKSELTEKIENSFLMFFDWAFVDKGAYTNIRKSNTDFKGNNHSILSRVNDVNYSGGQVYQTFHKNLVWESGLTVDNNINISGVYVNNTFVPLSTSGSSGYIIDYENGQVIFNTPKPANALVQMEYSYKTISFNLARTSPFLRFLQQDINDLSTNYFSVNSGQWIVGGEQRIQMPSIVLELSPSIRTMPYELGTLNKTHLTDMLVHVFSEDESITKRLIDIFINMEGQSLFILDIDKIAASGNYPFNYDGTLNSNRKQYPELVGIDDSSGFRQYKTYLKDIQSSAYNWMNYSFRTWISPNIHHSVTRFTLETVKTV